MLLTKGCRQTLCLFVGQFIGILQIFDQDLGPVGGYILKIEIVKFLKNLATGDIAAAKKLSDLFRRHFFAL